MACLDNLYSDLLLAVLRLLCCSEQAALQLWGTGFPRGGLLFGGTVSGACGLLQSWHTGSAPAARRVFRAQGLNPCPCLSRWFVFLILNSILQRVDVFFLLINFLLKDNCFTECSCFLSNLSMNQPQVYTRPLPLEPPSPLPPRPIPQVDTEPLFEFPEPDSKFLLAILHMVM